MHEFDKCILFALDGSKVSEGFVHDFEENTLKIYTQKGHENLVPGQELYAYIYNSVKGECRYGCKVDHLEDASVILYDVELVSAHQKRENTRVNKQLRYRVGWYYKGDQMLQFEDPINITILNLSATGLYMNCDRKFETGFRFGLVFKETKHPISLIVEIVRVEQYPQSYNYGCRFLNAGERDMDEIYRYVFREQIIQRRRERLV